MRIDFAIYLLAAVTSRTPLAGKEGGCAPPTGPDAIGLTAEIRHEMHFPKTRYGIRWTLADTANLGPVTDDSLCRLALTTIRNHMDGSIRPKTIVLIYAGPYFVAQQLDLTPGGSEFADLYILDRTLRHVIWPCPNDRSPPAGGTCPPRKP